MGTGERGESDERQGGGSHYQCALGRLVRLSMSIVVGGHDSREKSEAAVTHNPDSQ